MVGAGDLKIINNRDIVRELQTYHALTGTVNSQNVKLLALRANTLSVGATYGLAPFATMPEQDYFNLVANSPQLAATIRIQASQGLPEGRRMIVRRLILQLVGQTCTVTAARRSARDAMA